MIKITFEVERKSYTFTTQSTLTPYGEARPNLIIIETVFEDVIKQYKKSKGIEGQIANISLTDDQWRIFIPSFVDFLNIDRIKVSKIGEQSK